MRIRMLGTRRGADGRGVVSKYYKNCIYSIGENISPLAAETFLMYGWAETIDPAVYELQKFLKELRLARAA